MTQVTWEEGIGAHAHTVFCACAHPSITILFVGLCLATRVLYRRIADYRMDIHVGDHGDDTKESHHGLCHTMTSVCACLPKLENAPQKVNMNMNRDPITKWHL